MAKKKTAKKKTTKKAATNKSAKKVAEELPQAEAAADFGDGARAAELEARAAELEARVAELEAQRQVAVEAAAKKAEALRDAGERADGLEAALKAARAQAKAAARVPSLETEVRELRTANDALKEENLLLSETESRLETEFEAANRLADEVSSTPAGISLQEHEDRVAAVKVAVDAAVRAEAQRAIEATVAKARAKMQDLKNQLKAAESRLRLVEGGAQGERTYTREEVELHVRRMEQTCRVESERILAKTEKAARQEIERLQAELSRLQGG